ncbi:hypothetical protein ACFSM7_08935 [Clavibacter michiganensis subsp. tessellarius]|uniref:hypothetical protein n=1 Tax=Clavibacter tessellarius TaxID=31965 RepID=UPI00363C726D
MDPMLRTAAVARRVGIGIRPSASAPYSPGRTSRGTSAHGDGARSTTDGAVTARGRLPTPRRG